jgi:hypothetical protein
MLISASFRGWFVGMAQRDPLRNERLRRRGSAYEREFAREVAPHNALMVNVPYVTNRAGERFRYRLLLPRAGADVAVAPDSCPYQAIIFPSRRTGNNLARFGRAIS